MRYFLFLSIVLLAVACGVSAEEQALLDQEAALIEDIHRLHDVETMPKMGYLESLKNDLDALEDVEDSVVFDKKKQLDEAYDAMMGWMAQFNWQSDKTPTQNRVDYYSKEVGKLEEMKNIMYTAIDSAEVILKK